MDRFVLRVRELDDGVSDHTFELPSDWLGAQLTEAKGIGAQDGAGQIELTVTKQGREVLLRGTIRTILVVTCVRCLEEFDFPVDVALEVLMLPGRQVRRGGAGRSKENERGDEKDDLGVEQYLGDEIVLDELVRDTILLEVPMNPNCGESCTGWDYLRG